jgi:NhaP-type Na+/H+ or K+/H+ antiporter
MPIYVSYCLGYSIACISPSIIVPCMMGLIEKRLGIKKGIPSTLITAGIFDDVICIFCFSVCETVAFSKAGSNGNVSTAVSIIMVLVQIVTGAGIGVILGLLGWTFKFIKNIKLRIWVKFLYVVAAVLGFGIGSDLSGFSDAKFIGILFFGYSSFRVWGNEKPTVYLNRLWFCY